MSGEEIEILLVEDNPSDEELTVHALRRAKVANRIHVARDGEEALQFIFCQGKYAERSIESPPRVILLDLKLPKVSGIEVIRRIKADPRTAGILVVVLTSSKQDQDLVESYKLGANSYIQKPVDFDHFQEVVRQVGFYWLVVNQPPPARMFEPPSREETLARP